MKAVLRLWLPSALVLGLLVPQAAHADAPVSKRFVGTLIPPADAFTYFNGLGSGRTTGIAADPQRAPEIRALARSLNRDGALGVDAFAQRVADYVRRNIETEFIFGLGKGARGAAIDQSGTAFDQAELMVEIMRQGGQSAAYQLGTITLDSAQFGKWTGLVNGLNENSQTFTVNANATCRMLADGGIPALVNGASSCASVSGNLSSVTLAHVWVLVNGKAYDPSFKPSILRNGVDLPAAMGCGTSTAPTCGAGIEAAAVNGASQGTTSGAPWIQNVNRTGVEGYIQNRAQSLEGVIAGIGLTAPLGDIVGGMEIDQKYAPTIVSSLPYQQGVQTTWSGAIPDAYRTKFRLQFMGLDAVLFADEIAGKRTKLSTLAASNSFSRTSKINVEGVPVAQATQMGSALQLDVMTVSIDHPFAASSGSFGDDTGTIALATDPRGSDYCVTYSGGGTTTSECWHRQDYGTSLIFEVGNSGPGKEQHFGKLSLDDKENVAPNTSAFPLVKAMTVSAAKQQYQSALGRRIIEGIATSRVQHLHSMGGIYVQARPGDGTPYFNMVSGLTSVSRTGSASDEMAAFQGAATISAALEGSVLQQSEDAYESAASVSMFKLANDKSYRFYLANSSNISSVLSNTSNYTASRKTLLTSYAAAGYGVVIPSNGSIGTITFPGGAGSVVTNMSPDLVFNNDAVGYLILERWKGGGQLSLLDPAKSLSESVKANSSSMRDKSYYGVDLASGDLNLSPPPDLTIGAGSGALSFQRHGIAADGALVRCKPFFYAVWTATLVRSDCTPLGGPVGKVGPWEHNQSFAASWSGNGAEGLGQTSALRASKAIAAIYGLVDLGRSSSQTLPKKMAQIFTTYSLIDDFVRNTVSLPNKGIFVRLPSQRYDSPPSTPGDTLIVNGAPSAPFVLTGGSSILRSYANTSIILTAADGTIASYAPVEGIGYPGYQPAGYYAANNLPKYGATSIVQPDGPRRTFSYNITADYDRGASRKFLSQISNSFGNSLTLTGNQSVSIVSDHTGREVKYLCATPDSYVYPSSGAFYGDNFYEIASWCGVSVTDPLNGVSRVLLGPGDGSAAGSTYRDRLPVTVYTPSDATNAFLAIAYDPLTRVASYQDAAMRMTKIFTTNVSGDRFRIGERREPTGEVVSNRFDQKGSLTNITDPLGRETINVYDSAGRLLRTVFPEGNAVEYQYDIRGNQMRECKIGKTRVNWSSLTVLNERLPQCSIGLGDLVTTTVYLEGPTIRADQCTNPKTCNKPSYVVEPRFATSSDVTKRTEYTWSAVHGQLLTETKPSDDDGNRPVAILGYAAFTGQDGATFYLLTSRQDKIDASNTTTTTYEYDAANHWVLKSSVIDNGGLSLRTCYKFDATGNLISKTEPKANLTSCP